MPKMNYRIFESYVIDYLNRNTNEEFSHLKVNVSGYPHNFDMVSRDRTIIGDAKFLKDIQPIPPAKFDNISTYVWLLQHTKAEIKMLVFGRDRSVPEKYLGIYGKLTKDIEFYFLSNDRLSPLGENNPCHLLKLTKKAKKN